MQDVTQVRQDNIKIDKRDLAKDSIVAIIPTVLVLFLTDYFIVRGILPFLIILSGMPILVRKIRIKNNIQFTKKMIRKIILIELLWFVAIFVIIGGILYLFFD